MVNRRVKKTSPVERQGMLPGMEEESPAPARAQLADGCEIIIGTSGYQYRDWLGSVYPEGTKSRQMLSLYAKRFRAVELNSSYYGIPRRSSTQRMADETPPGFEFIVKAHKSTTHGGTLEEVPKLLEALSPLRDSGKLAGILCQFPWRFQNTPPAQEYLTRLREAFGELPVFIEFRHASWVVEPVFEFLAAHRLFYVSVDEPELEGLPPRVGRVTGPLGYIRFHSRSKENWWGGARYDYNYSESELSEWVERIQEMSRSARRIFVFFNNCHRGQAVHNAEMLGALLAREGLL